VPYTPAGMSNVGDQIMQALLATDAVTKMPVHAEVSTPSASES